MPAVILHDLAEVEELFLLRGCPLDHHVGEQQLVTGRGDFSGEGRIVRQLERLRRIGQQRMHRMAPLMRVGRQPIIFVAEVEQQIRVNVIGAGVHVSARSLAGPGQGIHPFARRHVREFTNVVGAQRLHRVDRQLAHLGQRVSPVRLHQRRIDVPIAHVGQAEHSAAKLEVTVQHRKAAVGLGDQRAVDRFGQVAAVERGLQRAVVMARLGAEQIALHLRGERSAETCSRRPCSSPRTCRRPSCARRDSGAARASVYP